MSSLRYTNIVLTFIAICMALQLTRDTAKPVEAAKAPASGPVPVKVVSMPQVRLDPSSIEPLQVAVTNPELAVTLEGAQTVSVLGTVEVEGTVDVGSTVDVNIEKQDYPVRVAGPLWGESGRAIPVKNDGTTPLEVKPVAY